VGNDEYVKYISDMKAKTVYDFPVVDLKYVITLFTVITGGNPSNADDVRPLFTKYEDITRDHVEILNTINDFVNTTLLKQYYANAGTTARFNTYLNLFDDMPRFHAQLVPPIGNISRRTYELHNEYNIVRLINDITRYDNFATIFKSFKRMDATSSSTSRTTSHVTSPTVSEIKVRHRDIDLFDNDVHISDANAKIKEYIKYLACIIDIGPTIKIIMGNNDSTKFCVFVYKFNKDVYTYLSDYAITTTDVEKYNSNGCIITAKMSNILPYTLIDYYAASKDSIDQQTVEMLIPSFYVSIPNMKKLYEQSIFKQVVRPVVELIDILRPSEVRHIVHGGAAPVKDRVEVDSIKVYRSASMVGISAKSKNVQTIGSYSGKEVFANTTVDKSKFDLVKYTIWMMPKAVYNAIIRSTTLNIGANVIFNYSPEQLRDMMKIVKDFENDIAPTLKHAYSLTRCNINSLGTTSLHWKLSSSRVENYNPSNPTMKSSVKDFTEFFDRDQVVLSKYSDYYQNFAASGFSPLNVVMQAISTDGGITKKLKI
jgi:hypothetical protein